MKNVFQKCLRRQMGNGKYGKYIELCRRDFSENSASKVAMDSKPIFDDMYEVISKDSSAGIAERMKDMLDTLSTAFRITKQFVFVITAYLAANLILLSLNLDYYVTCSSILLMGVCFLYKLVEFLSNKYCVMDAYLFMIYKSVLEKKAKDTRQI